MLTQRYQVMEDSPKNGHTLAQRQSKSHIAGRICKILFIIFFVTSIVAILAGKSVCCEFASFNRLFGQQPLRYNGVFPPENNEFRLVSVHRAGVGAHRNQVYQILEAPADAELHTSSIFGKDKYIIPSMRRQTTHLANQTRHHTVDYITRTRLFKQAARDPFSTYSLPLPVAQWVTRDVVAPNITDKATIVTLAKVASNAYIRIPDTEDWYDVGHKWNESTDFGWDEHGLRGHIFANADNSTVIVAMKGTSPPFVGGSDTSTNDKINVLMFPCCTILIIAGQHFVLLLLCSSLVYVGHCMQLLYRRNI
jgi:putative lipase involved disintegration of autophagic bodies